MKVTYLNHMGDDLEVANDARVSFGKKSEWIVTWYGKTLRESDKRIIEFLARGCTTGDWDKLVNELDDKFQTGGLEDIREILNQVRHMPTHWTPFGQQIVKLHIRVPIFVARQLFKHSVGGASSDLTVENELSRRYVTDPPEFWTPDEWRVASVDKKQGSGGASSDPNVHWVYLDTCRHSVDAYKEMLRRGICPEQARAALPQSTYTEWRTTGSLYYWANLYNTRTRPDTQAETREVAQQIGKIIRPLFPVSWAALTSGANDQPPAP